jgi:hypothetical protein
MGAFLWDLVGIMKEEGSMPATAYICFAQLFKVVIVVLSDLTAGNKHVRHSSIILSNKLDGCCEREGFDGLMMTTMAYIGFVIN